MRKYDSYKPTKIEFLDEIPEHWEEKRMRFLGYLYGGLSGKSASDFNQLTNEANKYFIPFTNIANNFRIDPESLQTVVISENENQNSVQKGDIFFLMSSENYDDVGKSAVLLDDLEETYLNSFCKGFRITKDDIVPEFLNYQLHSKQLRHNLLTGANGFTRINLKIDKVIDLLTALPTSKEQTAIAAYLDRKTAEIDELIADKKRLLELYEEEKTAIINQAVTKGINPNVPLKDSGIEWLGEIPEHWETVSLKWVSKIYSGGTPSKNNEDFWQNGTIPWLNSGTVNQFFITEPSEFITEEALNSSSAKWIPEYSIVIALAGQGKTKGMAAQVMFECTCNQSMGVIVPNDIIVNRFLLYYLTRNYQNIRNLGGGDKRDGINLEMVGGIPLPVIPLPEQAEIVRHIEDHSNLIDAKKAKTEKLIELLTEYRTALISEVVTGKIKVTD
ncbi:MAG: restriction endonuclease subunit S [Caldisericia bacterium]|nr:restriction endonuclease subunit S [Caldisericia bacterium]